MSGAIKTHVVVYRNDKGQIVSWVGRKAKPYATAPQEAKRFSEVEAHREARFNNIALIANGFSGSFAAEEADQWSS